MQENIPLAPLTTLRIGGPARYLARVETEQELSEALEFARGKELPFFVLGGGSNLLVGDEGFDGIVLQMAICNAAVFKEEAASTLCEAPAGMDWDALVLEACERGLSGVECLAGIPGLVGGTPVQNVGAYGQEVGETIASVRVLDRETMRFVSLSAVECGFGYRKSIFNSTARGRYIVTAATFRFEKREAAPLSYADLKLHFGDIKPSPLDVYHAVREIRHRKGMLLVEGDPDCRSAGSFFKNPVVGEAPFQTIVDRLGVGRASVPHWNAGAGQMKLAAAWLVEKAGFHKGFSMGRAGISSRHTLALINRGGATAAELFALRDAIQRRVAEQFGIELEQEPVSVGRDSSPSRRSGSD
jgi:UDP-N-acetylmuramate dehydrogenase